MSLIKILNKEIREKGFISIQRVHEIASLGGHKESNAERRLRKSESPNVEAVLNEKHHIIGYKWKQNKVLELLKPYYEKQKIKDSQKHLF